LLILVLAALLSAGVVAFLSLSSRRLALGTSDEAAQKAAALALLAQTKLVGNLKNEMAAGFAHPVTPKEARFLQTTGPAGPLNILYPAHSRGMVPARTSAIAPPNLVKWSSRFAPFYNETVPGTFPWRTRFPPAPPASPVSTLDRSANGKAISPRRWNATWLLPKLSPISSDATPQKFPVPDWICVNAKGEQRDSLLNQRADPIVGRYAYLVFDEGGLLDATVAGYASNLDHSVVAAKASTRVADLRPLFEAGGFSAAEAEQCNDAFVKWRDPAFLVGGANSYSSLLKDLGPQIPGRLYPGNRALVSRQALIRLFLDQLPGRLSARQNVLQYLGSFSRSLAQPQLALEWPIGTPPILPPAKGGNDAVGWNEGCSDQKQHLNPPFLMVRVKAPFLRRDGTWAAAGEPLVKKRFSLTLLQWIKPEATAAVGSPVERSFGLSRANAGDPWVYRPGQKRILTLDEVAELPGTARREPDFIELLKASIVAGSLAKSSVIDSLPPDESLDEAVIQIAANIIDQADEDGFPTRIQLEGREGVRVLSGIESLPYVSAVSTRVSVLKEAKPRQLLWEEDGTPSSPCSKTPPTDKGKVFMWQAVQLWNPHEASRTSSVKRRPAEFRLSVEAIDRFRLRLRLEDDRVPPGTVLSGIDPTPAPLGPRISGPQLRLNLPAAARAVFYRPEWVESPLNPSGLQSQLEQGNFLQSGELPAAEEDQIFGVGLAECAQVFQTGTAPNLYTIRASHFVPEPAAPFFYQLEYNAGEPGKEARWIAYDGKMGFPLAAVPAEGLPPVDYWPDPRTGRFGAFSNAQGHTEEQVRARFFQNSGASTEDYTDADGERRRGAGASGNATSPLDNGGRPWILDRPFRSVGELAFAFAGTPWRNVDFATPESGFSGLLEVFCVGENLHPDGLEVGRVNLNTRQVPVLQAVLAGADLGTGESGPVRINATGEFSAQSLAKELVDRTGSPLEGKGPFQDLTDLVGRRRVDGKYTGLASDLKRLFLKAPNGGTSLERHAIARTLGACGDTRVWNLLFDIIAQTGRFPPGSEAQGDLRNFVVEAEHRIWVHVAMDRLTGEVLDLQTEEVAE
jgi:hypothetical protein